ncbi:alpha-L-fucosidase [Reichenbachiella carrageenanivorans]|uniref:alpha-L-fucosidase n=1 Tax=Reichenbachiella carrageenanivorans TaxID=2979869 RepID=A0ABY6D3N8_9BACT|nr:alpha-L-fucosidase [Reichenbachiella carrageenanivorans]UXX80514.1 alpha-L-fucosidase [Reichenbachiella carrageenanivorans]
MKIILQLLVAFGFLVGISSCQQGNTESSSSLPQKEGLSWEDQKFSMFIHWGIYSIPAGIWNGEQISGYSEQIKGHAKIPTNKYRQLTKQFNPIHWNPDSVALLAKAAGMKSVVITAKHHDGFCLFDSKYTDFDVVDATPYKNDIIKGLSDACRKQGIDFGVYFSIIDWDFPGAMPFESTRNCDSIPPAHHQYNLNQVRELLTNYGEISELWFDMGAPTPEQSKEIADLVKSLQPNCMVSSRLWNDQGDFIVMGDNKKAQLKMGVPWQSPASMFHETWSYRSWQERPSVASKIEEKVQDLVAVVSSGGNYLLNIGPRGDGSIVPFERDVLLGIGNWLEVNGEAIYATDAFPVESQEWGYVTSKPGKLFLNVLSSSAEDSIVVKNLEGKFSKAYSLVNSDNPLPIQKSNSGVSIAVNNAHLGIDPVSVIVLEYDQRETIYQPSSLVSLGKDGTYALNGDNAEKYFSTSGTSYITRTNRVVKMKWYVPKSDMQNMKVNINYQSLNAEPLVLLVNGKSHELDDQQQSLNQQLTTIDLNQNQINEIELVQKNNCCPHKDLAIDAVSLVIH